MDKGPKRARAMRLACNRRDRLTRWREHAKAAFKKVPNGRQYAADDGALDALAALACAWQEQRAKNNLKFEPDALVKFFGELADAQGPVHTPQIGG
ncbi:MAG: hypothetical protein H0T92_19520 [Pyrinomonadaceae bacterium]|nr:hypothetical protein [Pyrinomonadaceae bacterium]